jgi:hypothetical protein
MFVLSMDDRDVVSNLENEDAIVTAHTAMCRDFADLLVFIAEHDRREAYKVDGARSMADWISYRLGYSDREARELVAVAKALEFLPAIADTLRAGLLTPQKARWLASFATIEDDAQLANEAIGMSAAEVRGMALERLRVTREMADARFRRRYLRVGRATAEGLVRGSFCLPDAEGEIVVKAIERGAKRAPTEAAPSFEERRADALVEICSLALGADADPDRATVVAHVDAEAFAMGRGNGTLEGGTAVAAETVRRLSCDGRTQNVIHAQGSITASPMKRTVPPHLYRQLRERDVKCAFPGCSNEIWLHAHHIVHFADGGPTTLSNLALLCGSHHRLIHEGGWTMRAPSVGERIFVRPDGTPLQRFASARAP